jgi:CrcB protein
LLQKCLFIGTGGLIGAVCRYLLGVWLQKISNPPLPPGTFAVNIIGCFLAGFFWVIFENRWQAHTELRLFIMVGFLGAFTTFSAFMVDNFNLLESAGAAKACLNILAHNLIGIIALFTGLSLGKLF